MFRSRHRFYFVSNYLTYGEIYLRVAGLNHQREPNFLTHITPLIHWWIRVKRNFILILGRYSFMKKIINNSEIGYIWLHLIYSTKQKSKNTLYINTGFLRWKLWKYCCNDFSHYGYRTGMLWCEPYALPTTFLCCFIEKAIQESWGMSLTNN